MEALRPTGARGAIDARWESSGFTLTAHITGLSRNGCLGFRFGRLRAKDQLEIWLHHLALCQAVSAGGELESVFVGTDRTLRLKHVPDGLAVMKDMLGPFTARGPSGRCDFFRMPGWSMPACCAPPPPQAGRWGQRAASGTAATCVPERAPTPTSSAVLKASIH